MKITKNNKINIGVAVGVVIAIILWGSLVWLVNNEANSLHQTIKEVKDIDSKKENLVTVKKNVDSVKVESSVLNSYFISTNEVVGFIELFEDIGNQLGVSFDVQKIEEAENLIFSFRVIGTEAQVISFVKLSENMPFALKFNSVIIKELEKTTEESRAKWQGDVNLTVLSFEQKNEN